MRVRSSDLDPHPPLRQVAIACVVTAMLVFGASLVVFATGLEVAVIPMMAAFGLFTFGVGALAAANRR